MHLMFMFLIVMLIVMLILMGLIDMLISISEGFLHFLVTIGLGITKRFYNFWLLWLSSLIGEKIGERVRDRILAIASGYRRKGYNQRMHNQAGYDQRKDNQSLTKLSLLTNVDIFHAHSRFLAFPSISHAYTGLKPCHNLTPYACACA